jgi:hypothetical protein
MMNSAKAGDRSGPRRLARRHGIRLRARTASAAGRTVTFADDSAADFDAVVWATGFLPAAARRQRP